MIKRLLIANRGEVAVRIIRACHEMGITTIAVYSTADKNSLFVREADQAIYLGPSQVTDSYLNKSSILMAALLSNADAIHPGYGLLSEDWVFSKLCEESGITFIGPNSTVIKNMGNKINSRNMMKQAGVKVVPGFTIKSESDISALESSHVLKFPFMLKSALGGGGKGIRKVNNYSELRDAMNTVLEEAQNSFGSTDIYIEQYLDSSRHIEVQIVGDMFGNIRIIGDRDCSVQRKNQKMIEQAPATTLTVEQKKQLYDQALLGAKSISYTSLGTMEFLLHDEKLYFLEMNTRLQVEHTVTEEVGDIDLVKLQLNIANKQNICNIPIISPEKGVAIECRLTAENVQNNFSPSAGTLQVLTFPTGGKNVRIDEGVQEGDKITPFYDSMIAKVIVRSDTREHARQKMIAVLDEIHIEGVDTNLALLKQILNSSWFIKDDLTTSSLEKNILKVDKGYVRAS